MEIAAGDVAFLNIQKGQLSVRISDGFGRENL
jgi:hypothetical protein